jgi:hypothetical protein
MPTVLTSGRSGWPFVMGALFVLAVGCLLVSAPAVAQDPGQGEVNISVEPAETDLEPNETITHEVVVEGAQEGIAAYAHLDIVIENPEVAQFVDFYETAEGNADGNITFTLTEIRDASGNKSESGPVFSMEAGLTGGHDFDGAEEIVIAELETEVLGSVPSATNLSIVENPDPEPIDEPEIAKDLGGAAYDVNALVDSELAVPAAAGLSLVPAETELDPGETTTLELVAEGAAYGIQSYDGIEVAVEDPGVAQFVNFTETAENNVDPGGEPPASDSEIRDASGNPAETGSVLWLDADLADGAFEGGDEVVLAEVEAELTSLDSTAVTIAGAPGLRDLQGIDYEITDTTNAALDPVGIDVTGNGKPATDTTGDGRLNNVDGDDAFDIFDVQAFFSHFEKQPVQDNPDKFNFNGGTPADVTIFDVQALFTDLSETS